MWVEYRRLIAFVVVLAAFLLIGHALRSVLLPFMVGLLLAYLLRPLVLWGEARLPWPGKLLGARRTILILAIFVVGLGLATLGSLYLFAAVADAFAAILLDAPGYIEAAISRVRELTESIRQQLSPEMQSQMDRILQDVARSAGNMLRATFLNSLRLIPTTVGLVFSLVILPVFLFYLMLDWEKFDRSLSASRSALLRHTRNILAITGKEFGRYARAQLFLGFVVGLMALVGLLIIGVEAAPPLAAFAALTEMIPIIGPWIGGIFAVIVTLASAPEKAIWVGFLFLIVQLLENSLLVPRVQAGYFGLHPAVIIFLLAVGAYLAGFWGVVLAAPLTATIVQVYNYVCGQRRDDPRPSAS